jgi:citrate synthase
VDTWRSAITNADGERVLIRGHDVVALMRGASYVDVVGLLLAGRMPAAGERRLLEAILIAIADHGAGAPSAATARLAANGNRAAPEAAVAAGILAIGDAPAGAGQACMAILVDAATRAKDEGFTLPQIARLVVSDARAAGRRLPGLGHRMYASDPRTVALFEMAEDAGVAGEGVALIRAIAAAVAEQIKPMAINVDGAIAAVLYDLGYPPATAKLLFIIGRTAGLAAHVLEEYERERPMRVRIPVTYDGPPPVADGGRQ